MTERGADVTHVATALSTERLAPYLRAMNSDLAEAVRLYEWNLAVSGAFYHPRPWDELEKQYHTLTETGHRLSHMLDLIGTLDPTHTGEPRGH